MTQLSKHIVFSNGRTSPERNNNGKYPVYGANGIIGYADEYNTSENTIIIGRVGAYCGSVYFSKEKCWVTDNAIVAKTLKDDFLFWFYFLKNKNLNSMRSGSGQPLLNQSILKSISTSNVTEKLNYRIDIGKKLALLDNKIHLNIQTNQTLEAIAQAIFKSWFVDFDPVRAKAAALSEGKNEHEANLAAMSVICGKDTSELSDTEYNILWQIAEAFPSELVQNEEFGEVPKGWGVMKIEDVINKIPTGKKYSQKTVEETGKVPVLDQGRSGLIGFHNDEAGVKACIEDPVIVFANHTCYMRLISYDFSAIQNVFAFKGNNCNIYWLYLATLGKQKFTEYKGHFPDFLIKQIIIPSVELTKLFGDFVKPQFISIFENDKQIKILSEVRDLLLPKLLSREIQL
ncbi:type I restriction endonuclease subunit S [Bibersteinia trehalosi Y31]|uniref:Type I restriction endonuclease subunit S n=1 Tax=Bibersteinia trehalosi Y31 TaxID=1261658 RepID=A0A179CYK8_BIBTR|nr:restriction endonuclease subunit S [Bibersteinia trehalosi]OAQ14994.1 type I restriction endonuclease subunit S [Bibersteinia trehalosi Y31]